MPPVRAPETASRPDPGRRRARACGRSGRVERRPLAGHARLAERPPITDAYWLIFGITGAVFVLVEGTLLVFVIRYRRRGRPRAAEGRAEPRRDAARGRCGPIGPGDPARGDRRRFVFYKLPGIKNAPAACANPLNVRVEAHQFYWLFRYPDGHERSTRCRPRRPGRHARRRLAPTSRTAGGFPRSAARSTRFPARRTTRGSRRTKPGTTWSAAPSSAGSSTPR